jgi:hypothetical protein
LLINDSIAGFDVKVIVTVKKKNGISNKQPEPLDTFSFFV